MAIWLGPVTNAWIVGIAGVVGIVDVLGLPGTAALAVCSAVWLAKRENSNGKNRVFIENGTPV
jgi:hypothetical protein